MSQYNVSLRVSYDGKAVAIGAAQNASDLAKLQTSTTKQGAASVATATKNKQLAVTTTSVDAAAKKAVVAQNKLTTDITQTGTAATSASQKTNVLAFSHQDLTAWANKNAAAIAATQIAIHKQGIAAAKAAQQNTQLKASYESVNQSAARAIPTQQRLASTQNTVAAATKRSTVATAEQGRVAANTATKNSLLGNSFRGLAAGVSLYVAAYAGLGVVQDVSASEQLSTRIENLTANYDKNAAAQVYLTETGYRLNVRYSTLADGYGKFLALQKAGVQTSYESKSILEGLTNAAKELGASNASVAQTIYGYSQAATQGVVQSTELLQVTEPLPGLLQNIDKAAGLAAGGFKKLTGEGKVTSAFFKQVLIKALYEYEGAAEASAHTINAASQDFLTTYDTILVKLQKPINSAIVPVINTANSALVLLGDNVDVLGDVADSAVLLGTVLAGKLAGSVTASTVAFVQNKIAAQAKLVADREVAASALVAAKTQAAYTVQLQAGAQRQLVAAQTDNARSAALTHLALRNGQAIATQRALAVATASYTAAARAATITTRGLSGAMAFLGGPIGVVVTAALAIGYFATSADDAEAPTKGLTQKVKDLSDGYKQLTQAQLKLRDVRVDEQVTSLGSSIDVAKVKLAELQNELNGGKQIANNSLFGGIAKVPLTQEEIKSRNTQIIEQEAELETLEKSKNSLLLTQEQIKRRIASGSEPEEKTTIAPTITSVDYSKELAKLEVSLQTQKEKIKASYANRQTIIENSLAQGLVSQDKYNELSLRVELERDAELDELQRSSIQTRQEREREAEEERLRNLQVSYENELAVIQGFEDRKALLQYKQDEQIADDKNKQQILHAQGFKDQSEKDEHTRQEALLNAETSRTGEMQSLLFSRAEWERKNELEKTESMLDIGEYGFKQMAGQSKKAFAMYKAFSIAKAIMNTYEMATGAFNALVNIPIVGPALATVAAAGAVAYGLNQVNTIKSQQYSAAYHGGRDYIPEEQTALLQRGERVVSPRQNVALTAAAEKINKGETGGGNVHLEVNNTYHVADTSENSINDLEVMQRQSEKRIESMLISQLRNGAGNFYKAVKSA